MDRDKSGKFINGHRPYNKRRYTKPKESILKCKKCGNDFIGINFSNRRYCNSCRFSKCLICKKVIYLKPKEKEPTKFCSKRCFNIWQRGRKRKPESVRKSAEGHRGKTRGKIILCEFCGKQNYKYPRDIRKGYKRYFCSRNCFLSFKKANASTKRNNKEKEKQWKRAIYKKDNYTCQICEGYGLKLNAHHLKKWSKYPKLRYKISNGITLCLFCHRTYTDYGAND